MSTFTYTDYSPSNLIGQTLTNINTSFRGILSLVHDSTEAVAKCTVIEGCEVEIVSPGNGRVTAGKFVTEQGHLHSKLFSEVFSFLTTPETSNYVFYTPEGAISCTTELPSSSSVFVASIDIDSAGNASVKDLRSFSRWNSGTKEIFSGRSTVLSLKKNDSGSLIEGFLNSTKTFSVSSSGVVEASSVKISGTPTLANEVVTKGVLDSQITTLNTQINNVINTEITTINSEINTLKNTTIPGINTEINTLKNTTIPGINTDISNINGLIVAVNLDISDVFTKLNSRSFAQLLVIGDLKAHAIKGGVHDFYLNVDQARTIRKIALTCPTTGVSGSIELDIKKVTSPGESSTSLFSGKPLPSISCNGGSSWTVLNSSSITDLIIPDSCLIQVIISSAPDNCFDLRVELFE